MHHLQVQGEQCHRGRMRWGRRNDSDRVSEHRDNELAVLLADLGHREADLQYQIAHQDKLYLTGYTTLATVAVAAVAVNAVGDTLDERLSAVHPFSFLLVAIVLLWIPVASTVGVVKIRVLGDYISNVVRPRVAVLIESKLRAVPAPLGWQAHYHSRLGFLSRRNALYHVGGLFREGILAAPSVAVFVYYWSSQSALLPPEARPFEYLLVGMWFFGILSPVVLMAWVWTNFQLDGAESLRRGRPRRVDK